MRLANPLAPRRHRARKLALALAAGLSLCSGQTFAQATVIHTVDIAAQPLEAALAAFERATGAAVERPPALQGQSRAVSGSQTDAAALDGLLAGSGWRAVPTGSGFRLVAARDTGSVDGYAVPALTVDGQTQAAPFQSGYAHTQATLQAMPLPRGQLTAALRLNPAVQLDGSGNSSHRAGELEPSSISIHGAPFWQNLFAVDGMSVNNDINPGNTDYTLVNSSISELPGNTSQGIALDTSLVERLEVYDSNVPAEFGGFNGGVVNAVTRAPRRELHGSLSLAHTRDAWTTYNIDPLKEAEFYNTAAIADGWVRNQQQFRTTIKRVQAEGPVSANAALLASFTGKRSDIAHQRRLNQSMLEAGATLEAYTDVYRQIDTYFLKSLWTPTPRFTVETTLTHEPHKSQHFNRNALNGDFLMESGGTTLGLALTHDGDGLTQVHRFTGSQLQNSRTGGPGWFARWRPSAEINWGEPTPRGLALYGTFGDLYQNQRTLAYQGKFEWAPMTWVGGEHRIAFGLGYARAKAEYRRKADFTDGGIPALRPTRTCTDANGVVDTRHCSASPLRYPEAMPPAAGFQRGDGQYASFVYLYRAGQAKVHQDSWSLWLDDDMRYGALRLRPGLRVDGDDYMGKITYAPRLALDYELVPEGRSRLSAGLNRYYGRNVFDYALRVGRESLEYTMARGPDLVWRAPVRTTLNTTVFRRLDIPYDDEAMIGFHQIAGNTAFDLKYVQRAGRRQIVAVRGSEPADDPQIDTTRYYTYRNIGRTDSRTLSLMVQPLKAYEWGGMSTQAQLVADWTRVKRSHVSYEARHNDYYIEYEGNVIRWNERPLENYNQPWSVRALVQTRIARANLSISQLLSWRGPYAAAAYTGRTAMHKGEEIDVYARRTFGTAFGWDMRLSWEKALGRGGSAVFANLDITNVLNRRNVSTHVEDWAGAYNEYELGRQFQLEIGLRF